MSEADVSTRQRGSRHSVCVCLACCTCSTCVRNDLRRMREIRDRVNRRRLLHPRMHMLRDRSNPLEEYNDHEFRRRFRFSKETVMYLTRELHENLVKDRRGSGLPVHLQLLIVLRFFATNAFNIVLGDLVNVHESKVCRLIKSVSEAICLVLKTRYVYFPPRREHVRIKAGFAQLSRDNFPGVIGAIDCTHIKIVCPARELAERFYNRKCCYSINCQVVCDNEMNITNIVARWPGSTHDSRIFRNSTLKDVLETGVYNAHLIGDSGYPCTRYLLTPVLRERTAAEGRYNAAHKRARNIIERVFGSWKRRFPCLQTPLRVKLVTVQRIIVATAILHNVAIRRREEEFNDVVEEEEEENVVENARDEEQGVAWRRTIIANHFS